MDVQQQLTEIITEAGNHDENIALIVRRSEGLWQVDDEDLGIELEFHEATGRLVLTADLGAPPRERRAEVYEALLSYAMLWRDTACVRAGLGGEGGELSLMADIGTEGLLPAALAEMLANFGEKSRLWRKYVSAEAMTPAPGRTYLEEAMQIWA